MASATDDLPVALITGATRGIGKAIAAALAPDHRLLIGGRDPEATARAAARYPSATPFTADLADERATREAVAALQLDRLDVLVHSAGIATMGPLALTDRETWRSVLELDVIAVADLTRLLLPALRAAGGLVITINSGAGFHAAQVGEGLYAAAKFALRAYTDGLREELRGEVRVSSIHPGRVATDMQVERQRQLGRPWNEDEHLAPADVAAAVRLAVTLPHSANVDELQIRPA
jgi:NADP-dependent 3-hydroxy acid dehydrogenase YdfG